jgi:protein-L-isoaspartate(D-aspartate) O-methyltransferase
MEPRAIRVRWLVAGLLLVLCGSIVLWAVWEWPWPRGQAVEQGPVWPAQGALAAAAAADEDTPEARARRRMVERHLRGRDITDQAVLEVMGRVERHRFVPDDLQALAYADHPLPIGHGQTISQPYIVALMTQLVRPKKSDRALDIGTGSGYQAAVLAELCEVVYGIEILEPLADVAKKRLAELGYKNVTVRPGDGYQGWPEKAPFDVIIVAAAPDHVPKPLVEQLAPGGRLVIPVGRFDQELLLLEKQQDGSLRQKSVIPVRFVPMTGKAQQPAEDE